MTYKSRHDGELPEGCGYGEDCHKEIKKLGGTTSIEDSMHVKQDSTKKKAAVDTVRLKKDIDKDLRAGINDQFKIGASSASIRRGVSSKIDRSFDRRDTLEMVRKGKIPAKKSK